MKKFFSGLISSIRYLRAAKETYTDTPGSHIMLYILALIQTVATIVTVAVGHTGCFALHFSGPSVIFTLLGGEFILTPIQMTVLPIWGVLRITLLILAVIGFWQSIPRKGALIILTVTTVWEIPFSLLCAVFSFGPLFLTAIMMSLCIKGFSDLKELGE